MPFDKTKNQRKGFCFITFDSEQVVNELLRTPKQTIKDKEVSLLRFLVFINMFLFFNLRVYAVALSTFMLYFFY